MSKFRAFLVSSLLATALVGGAVATAGDTQAKSPTNLREGTSWCC